MTTTDAPLWGRKHGTSGHRYHRVEHTEPFNVRAYCGAYLDTITDERPDFENTGGWPNPPRFCPQCKANLDALEGVAP